MSALKEYLKPYPLGDPAYNVVRIAGRRIRQNAASYFSGRLLEIGCGSKRKGLLVDEFVNEHIGLDHEHCPHDRSQIDVFASAYDIPAAENSYDCILSTAVMEHLEEPQRAADEAFRVLRTGGHALYTLPLVWHLHEEPRDFFRYTKYGVKHLFEKAGFEIVVLEALSGFWTTFGTELNYYLQRFRRGPFRPLFHGWIAMNNLLFPLLDRGFLRSENFTWAYLIVLRKP